MTKTPMALLLDKITIIETETFWNNLFSESLKQAQKSPFRIGFVNAHAVNMAYRDDAFLNDLLGCECLLRDGAGMKILYKLQGISAGLNQNGTDLIPKILGCIQGQSIALFGTQNPTLTQAAQKLKEQGHNIICVEDGFQKPELYNDVFRKHTPFCVVLAMGMPRQEQIAHYLAMQNPNHPCLILCGGAILDFIGGKVSRAPAFMRRLGLEWLYRLILEPRRLAHRYLIGNAVFLMHALSHSLKTLARKG